MLDVRDMIRPQEGVRLEASVVDGATGARLDSLPISGRRRSIEADSAELCR